MGELPRFRELKGISQTAEASLHRAGIRSWRQLSDVLAAVTRMPGITTADLRELAREARERDTAGADDGERHHAFIVHVAMDADQVPIRSWVVDTRAAETTDEGWTGEPAARWAGWQPQEIVSTIETMSGVVVDRPGARGRPETPEAGHEPEDAERVSSASQWPDVPDVTSVDLGVAARGWSGTREFVVEDLTPAVRGFEYRAALLSRALGATEEAVVARAGGLARAGAAVTIPFTDVQLPEGVQRLRLVVETRSSAPGRVAPQAYARGG